MIDYYVMPGRKTQVQLLEQFQNRFFVPAYYYFGKKSITRKLYSFLEKRIKTSHMNYMMNLCAFYFFQHYNLNRATKQEKWPDIMDMHIFLDVFMVTWGKDTNKSI